MATLAERLSSVQTAIAAIEGGVQNYTYQGRSMTYGDLQTLYEQERYLEGRIGRAAAGGHTLAEF
jgi:hypothetical protein